MDVLVQILSAERLYAFGAGALRVLAILLIALIAARVATRMIRGLRKRILEVMSRRAGDDAAALEKRAGTIITIIRKSSVAAIWVVALIMAFREMGFDIGPILAGAGVLGLAVGFGAQNLVRDVISGLFMLVENQIRVGDVAIINGTGGLVEEVNLRTTVLRNLEGTVHVFPNGTITTLANMTRDYSFYLFEIGVAYKEDADQVMDVIRAVADEMRTVEPYAAVMLEPVEIFGVDKFADSAVVIKGRLKAEPMQQWMVGREFNRRLKRRFDELGIEIPFPHRSIYFGEGQRRLEVLGHGASQAELKALLREVVAESGREPSDR